MWLYIPLNCLPEQECLERDSVADLNIWASGIALVATLSGKLTRPQFWLRAWKREAWTKRLSGPMLPPSTQELGVGKWIASLQDSHAKTYRSPDGALALTENAAAFSLRLSESQPIAVRGSFFWRTSQASLLPPPPLWTKRKANLTKEPPPASWENWPTAGGTRNGSLFQRPMWVPATAEQDGSALRGERDWATPQARDSKNPDSSESGNYQRKLEQGYTIDLNSQAHNWPPPMAADDGHKVTKNSNQVGLIGAAYHFSPLAQATRDGATSSPQNHGEALLSALKVNMSPRLHTKRLNPYFSEWLMGMPLDWTSATKKSASSASATELFRNRQQLLLCCLLGERD